MAVADFENVSKSYRDPLHFRAPLQALRGVTLRVEAGVVFGLLGPNRAGKTTLLKVLLGLCKTDGGKATRLDRPLSDRSTLAQVGYVHENHAFPRYLTASNVLEYYGALTLMPQEAVRRRAPGLLARFGLADRAQEPIGRFSKGMLQRLGMAQALLNEPRLLVLDEPTEGLDLDGRHLLHGAVAEVRGKGGAVLLVSHVLAEVEQLCDQAAILVQGRLAYRGSMADLRHNPSGGPPRALEQVLQEVYQTPPQ